MIYVALSWEDGPFTHALCPTHVPGTVMCQAPCQSVRVQRWAWHRFAHVSLVVSFISCGTVVK